MVFELGPQGLLLAEVRVNVSEVFFRSLPVGKYLTDKRLAEVEKGPSPLVLQRALPVEEVPLSVIKEVSAHTEKSAGTVTLGWGLILISRVSDLALHKAVGYDIKITFTLLLAVSADENA